MRNKKILIVSIILSVIIIHLLVYYMDYSYIKKDKNPVCSIPLTFIKDGGSVVYYGFGYQVIYWYFAVELENDNKKVNGYMTGYEIHHLFFLKYIPFIKNNITPDKNVKLKFVL